MGSNLNGKSKKTSFLKELKKTIKSEGKKKADSLQTAETCLKLALVGTRPSEISKLTGVEITSVKNFTKSIKEVLTNFDPNKLLAYRENTVSILQSLEAEMLQYMASPEKLEKAPLNQVAYAYEVMHKARRLEEGKSTENHSNLITIQGEKYR